MSLKIISRENIVYSFSPRHKPVEHVKIGDLVLFKAIDALGGQIKTEEDTIEDIDWSKVDGITGPIYIDEAEPGDVLVVKIHDIRVEDKGFMVVVPGYGALGHRELRPKIRIVDIDEDHVFFNDIRVKVHPMIGTIGVAPEDEDIPAGSLGRHGGNMDCKEVRKGAVLYFPVFTRGALFGLGDLHAVQADGELSVSAVEVSGEVLVEVVDVLKNKKLRWPVLKLGDKISILACANTLDDAVKEATETAVKALMNRYSLSFEEAYMMGSLLVDLEINQVVDPKKGVRATIPIDYLSIENILE